MTRAPLLALALLAGCAFYPPPVRAVQTFIPPGGLVLTTSNQTTVLTQAFTSTGTSQGFFFLASLPVQNQTRDAVQLTILLDEASAAFSTSSITVMVPGSSLFTYQVPISAANLSAGPYTAEVKVVSTAPNALVLTANGYLGIFGSSVPGTVITSLGVGGSPQTGAAQFLAVNLNAAASPGWTSASNIHTLLLPPAAAGASSGLITNASQTIAGVKTFTDGVASPGTANATQRLGAGATASGANDTAIGAAADTGDSGSTDNTIVGAAGVVTSSDEVTGVGAGVTMQGDGATGFGSGVTVSNADGQAYGRNANASAKCIVWGGSGTCVTAAAAELGSTGMPITLLQIGKGPTSARAA